MVKRWIKVYKLQRIPVDVESARQIDGIMDTQRH